MLYIVSMFSFMFWRKKKKRHTKNIWNWRKTEKALTLHFAGQADTKNIYTYEERGWLFCAHWEGKKLHTTNTYNISLHYYTDDKAPSQPESVWCVTKNRTEKYCIAHGGWEPFQRIFAVVVVVILAVAKSSVPINSNHVFICRQWFHNFLVLLNPLFYLMYKCVDVCMCLCMWQIKVGKKFPTYISHLDVETEQQHLLELHLASEWSLLWVSQLNLFLHLHSMTIII